MVTNTEAPPEYTVHLRPPHYNQALIRDSKAKRKVVRAGRRGGKTVIASIIAVDAFLAGRRVLYATPTVDQLDKFWRECKKALQELIDAKAFTKNETFHYIERPGTEERIRAKTAWNADTLRGDYADLLILDEWQLMNEDTWEYVGAPMLLDNDGNAIFIYTPPSLYSTGVSKARDPRHAAKLFVKAQNDTSGRWQAFHFISHDNPHLSLDALDDITQDMSQVSYRQEILAEDDDKTWAGLIYKSFHSARCIFPRFEIPKDWHIHVGHDFGGANPAAMFYAQEPATGFYWAFHEYFPGPGKSTVEHVDEFKRITEGYTVVTRSGGSHQEDEIRQGYSAHGWHIKEPRENNVKAGIDKVIAMHETDKIKVFEDLHRYLFEKANYAWKMDTQGQISGDIQDKAKYHLMDSERYLMTEFRPDTVKGSGTARLPYGMRLAR